MTKQQAIDYLTENVKDKDALRIATEAIQKQIMLKPLIHYYQNMIMCAECGAISRLSTSIYYCPKCGRKVDWR